MASGCLGLISFPREPGRVTLERLEELHPRLLPALRDHPGIGFVLVRSERDGALVLGARGTHYLDDGRVEGEDPLAPFGPNAADHVRRTDAFPHCPDVMVNSTYWDETGRGRRLRGAGRLARRPGRHPVLSVRAVPVRAALARRAAWSAPSTVHRIFRGWLAALGHDAYEASQRRARLEHAHVDLGRQLGDLSGERRAAAR